MTGFHRPLRVPPRLPFSGLGRRMHHELHPLPPALSRRLHHGLLIPLITVAVRLGLFWRIWINRATYVRRNPSPVAPLPNDSSLFEVRNVPGFFVPPPYGALHEGSGPSGIAATCTLVPPPPLLGSAFPGDRADWAAIRAAAATIGLAVGAPVGILVERGQRPSPLRLRGARDGKSSRAAPRQGGGRLRSASGVGRCPGSPVGATWPPLRSPGNGRSLLLPPPCPGHAFSRAGVRGLPMAHRADGGPPTGPPLRRRAQSPRAGPRGLRGGSGSPARPGKAGGEAQTPGRRSLS